MATRPGLALRGLAALPVVGLAWAARVLTLGMSAPRDPKALEAAHEELRRLVSQHDGRGYSFWSERVGKMRRLELTAIDGTSYQARIEAVWDGEPNNAVRVLFALDGGPVSATNPISESLLVEPERQPATER